MADAPTPAAPPPTATPQANASGQPPADGSNLTTPLTNGKAPPKPKAPTTVKKPVEPKPGQDASATGGEGEAKPAEAEKEEELFEVVVKGEKRKLTREQVIRRLQKEDASEDNFRQAKEATKKVQAILQMMKEDPATALKELGVDADEFAKSRLSERIQQDLMTPEQRELAELKAERAKYQAADKQREEAAAKAKEAESDKVAFAAMEKGFLTAAKKHGVEGTPENFVRMIEIASEALEGDYPLTEDQVMAELKDREDAAFRRMERQVVGGLKGEKLAQRLGPTVVEEILKWSVERYRGQQQAAPPPAPPAEEKPKASPYITEGELKKKEGW